MIIILAYSVEKNRLLARIYGNPIKGHPIKQVQSYIISRVSSCRLSLNYLHSRTWHFSNELNYLEVHLAVLPL